MRSLVKYPLVAVFFGFLYVFVMLDVVMPGKTRSEIENRTLAQMPKMTLTSLINNTYTSQLEVYTNDHFPFRDDWITLKSLAESALMKTENNGIAYGADGYLFEKGREALLTNFSRNVQRVAQFAGSYPGHNVTLAIVPGVEAVLTDKLPMGFPVVDQAGEIAAAYDAVSQAGGGTLDVLSRLREHSSEYIYYRTDHHWTTEGAIIAGEAFLAEVGRELPDIGKLAWSTVEGFLGTHYSKAKNWDVRPDVITYYDLPLYEVTVDGEAKDGYYDPAMFAERDKYAAFLWGNAGLTALRRVNEPQSRLLVIKDSYANCLAPYLAMSYDEVVVIDLRSTAFRMSGYLAAEEFDDILILYSFRSFGSDNNIAKLNY